MLPSELKLHCLETVTDQHTQDCDEEKSRFVATRRRDDRKQNVRVRRLVIQQIEILDEIILKGGETWHKFVASSKTEQWSLFILSRVAIN